MISATKSTKFWLCKIIVFPVQQFHFEGFGFVRDVVKFCEESEDGRSKNNQMKKEGLDLRRNQCANRVRKISRDGARVLRSEMQKVS